MKPAGHIGALTFGASLDELDVERHSFLSSITDVDRTVIRLEMSWKLGCRNKIAATATQGSMITIIKNNQNRSMAQNRIQHYQSMLRLKRCRQSDLASKIR